MAVCRRYCLLHQRGDGMIALRSAVLQFTRHPSHNLACIELDIVQSDSDTHCHAQSDRQWPFKITVVVQFVLPVMSLHWCVAGHSALCMTSIDGRMKPLIKRQIGATCAALFKGYPCLLFLESYTNYLKGPHKVDEQASAVFFSFLFLPCCSEAGVGASMCCDFRLSVLLCGFELHSDLTSFLI